MKRLLIVACLITGYSYGMNAPVLTDKPSEKKFVTEVSEVKDTEGNKDKVNINLLNTRSIDLVGSSQNIVNTTHGMINNFNGSINENSVELEDNVFDTSYSTYIEGRIWTVGRKIAQPTQIVTSASTMILIALSEITKTTSESLSTGFSYGALGSAVASGVLSLCIAKMTDRINTLNKIYKAKLSEENKEVKIIMDETGALKAL